MLLTDEESRMLSGELGEGVRIAAHTLVALGESQGAARLVPIRRAHAICSVDALACDPGLSVQGGLVFLEKLLDGGARCRDDVMLTLQPPGIDLGQYVRMGVSVEYADLQIRILEALKRLGAVPAFTCVPYLSVNTPAFGERVAFGESSVAVYANSAIGARTNRESGPTPICAAILGRIPEYGLLLDENRRGQVLVHVTARLDSPSDFGLLGAYLGARLQDQIPVLEGLASGMSEEELKYLGSCLSVTGSVSMFHVVGVTPESPTREAAFGTRAPDAVISVTDAEMRETRELLRAFDGPVDLVLLGNPQYSLRELATAARLLAGRRVCASVRLFVCTDAFQRLLADRLGYVRAIEGAGGEVVDICGCGVRETRIGKHAVHGFQRVVTDGVKSALYIRDGGHAQVVVGSAEECVAAAVSGRWPA